MAFIDKIVAQGAENMAVISRDLTNYTRDWLSPRSWEGKRNILLGIGNCCTETHVEAIFLKDLVFNLAHF